MKPSSLGRGLSLALCVLALSAAPAVAVPAVMPGTPTGPNLLDLEYSADTVRLTPGETSSWDVLVTFVPDVVDELVLDLDTPLDTGMRLKQDLTVQAWGCSEAFTPDSCPGRLFELLPVVPFTEAAGSEATVLRPVRDDLAGPMHIRVNVTLAEDTDLPADHEPATLHLTATASGSETATETAPELVPEGAGTEQAGPGSGFHLPETGATILGYAILGIAAVLSGLLIAGSARRICAAGRNSPGVQLES